MVNNGKNISEKKFIYFRERFFFVAFLTASFLVFISSTTAAKGVSTGTSASSGVAASFVSTSGTTIFSTITVSTEVEFAVLIKSN